MSIVVHLQRPKLSLRQLGVAFLQPTFGGSYASNNTDDNSLHVFIL